LKAPAIIPIVSATGILGKGVGVGWNMGVGYAVGE
jgi:hypothetical protein